MALFYVIVESEQQTLVYGGNGGFYMLKRNKTDKRRTVWEKELQYINKQEEKLRKTAEKNAAPGWKEGLEKKIPPKIYGNLEKAFCKAFSFIFEKGNAVIEKSYNKDAILKDYAVRNYAVHIKGTGKELKQLRNAAKAPDMRNMAITTVEGIGLGALGIGLPDIVVFTGFLLKGIYETALHYGYDYEKPEEKLLILKMMEAALSKGEDWNQKNGDVDRLLRDGLNLKDRKAEVLKAIDLDERAPEPEDIQTHIAEQTKRTAQTFALDMLLLKFVQGLPVIGILGGAGNPLYYRKVLQYVQIKYQKRYLLSEMKK